MKAGRSICYVTWAFFFVADFFGSAPGQALHAQNTVVGAPLLGLGDSSFENIGGRIAQPLGANDAGARLGFSILGDGGTLNFNLTAGQGSSRSMVAGAPLVTVANGGTGTFMDVVQQPFVVGFTPVVGGWSNYIVVPPRIPAFSIGPTVSPLQDRIQRLANGEVPPEISVTGNAEGETDDTVRGANGRSRNGSSAEQPDIGVAQIQRQQQARDAAEEATIAAFIAAARQAENAGDLSRALKLVDKARRESRGARRRACEDELRALRARIQAGQRQ